MDKSTRSSKRFESQFDHKFLHDSTKVENIVRDATSLYLLNDCFERAEWYSKFIATHNTKAFGLMHENLTYRKVANWIETGLLLPAQREEGEWKKYSILDIFWVDCIDKLRDFGLSIEILKKVRANLMDGDMLPGSEYPSLEFYFMRYIFHREKHFLLVFSDGNAYPLSLGEYISFAQMTDFNHNDYIRIDLYTIFTRRLLGINYRLPEHEFVKETYVKVSLEELVTIHHLRSDKNTKSVTVDLNREDPKKRIKEWKIEKIRPKTGKSKVELMKEPKVVSVEPIEKKGHLVAYKQRISIKNPPKEWGKYGSKFHPE